MLEILLGPTADGFETYGVTGVALIAFILLAIEDVGIQKELLVWIFAMRILMIATSIFSYWINNFISKIRYGKADDLDFEVPSLTSLIWITSILSIIGTFATSYILIPEINGNADLWWILSIIISLGTLGAAVNS